MEEKPWLCAQDQSQILQMMSQLKFRPLNVQDATELLQGLTHLCHIIVQDLCSLFLSQKVFQMSQNGDALRAYQGQTKGLEPQ